ncbi:MAG: thioesterase family protein [Chitinophagaceae bacterium]
MFSYIRAMIVSNTHIRVRYGEVDQMGFLYYGNYALYFEVARAEMIRELDYTYAQMEKDGVVMPVVKMQCKYIKPVLYDEYIRIETTLKEHLDIPFITFNHKLFNEQNELLHVGQVTLTFFDPKKQQRVAMPDTLRKRIEPFFKKI